MKPLLHPYQRKWIADKSRFKIGMFARQTGKTFTNTLEIVDDVFRAELNGDRRRWVILSRGERQAKEAMDEGVKRHAQAYQLVLNDNDYDFKGDNGTVRALEVELPNGSKITAIPANPDTARGFTADLLLDEFAHHKDSRKIWTALFPVVSAGKKLRVVSTPNGKGNKFYELMTGDNKQWSPHVVDIYHAVKDGLPRDVKALREALADEDAWAQEYELKWLDEASAWLPYDLIDSVEDINAGKPELYQGGHCFIGNDIAARNDLWVAVVLELVGDVLWVREIIARKRIPFAEQDRIMDELLQRYRAMRLSMDQTGMGEKPVEDAKRRYGEHRVEGVLFTGANKLMLATEAKEAFEDRRIRIPGNPRLRSELHKIKKTVGPTGMPRFVAESDSTGHADIAWAMFLAIHAASAPRSEIAFMSTEETRLSDGLMDYRVAGDRYRGF
ncbi:MAG: terminase family protein [Alphaproteobacteria bacterium]